MLCKLGFTYDKKHLPMYVPYGLDFVPVLPNIQFNQKYLVFARKKAKPLGYIVISLEK